MNCRDLLSDARGEVSSLLQKIDDFDQIKNKKSSVNLHSEIKMKSKRAASVTEKKFFANHTKKNGSPPPLPIKSKTVVPLPTVSSSMPTATLSGSPATAIVHHHYHYHVKKNQQDEGDSHHSQSDVNSSDFMTDCCDTEKVILKEMVFFLYQTLPFFFNRMIYIQQQLWKWEYNTMDVNSFYLPLPVPPS